VSSGSRREHLDLAAREPDLLLRFPQGGVEQRGVARLVLAAGEPHLPAVDAGRPARHEHDPHCFLRVAEERHQHGRRRRARQRLRPELVHAAL
jgi:hypothetical protein